ncbi:hypothetical protein JYT51_00340 [Candidatus Amoebophilus asiaticus]|nr:hypothetical protein [Candidatus Amoebophilus asiaticus]
MTNKIFWQVPILTIILYVLQSAFSFLIKIEGIDSNLKVTLWTLFSDFLIVSILWIIAEHSKWTGLKLIGSLFLLYFGIFQFNSLIEAYFFDLDMTKSQITQIAISGFFISLLFTILLTAITGKTKKTLDHETCQTEKRSLFGWSWRIITCVLIYIMIYITAGLIIFPYVQEFYAGRNLPGVQELLLVQAFRGLIFTLIALPTVIMIKGSRIEKTLLIGLAFSIIGGIAPLIIPNPILPENVRLVHGFEVGISNFVYGCILALILTQKEKELRQTATNIV